MSMLKKVLKFEIDEEVTVGDVIVREIAREVPASDGRQIKVFAYYEYPVAKKNKNLPAIVWVHCGGKRC
jgi:dipeptidyl aminopeptidase/acylaminoacyl peptidase